MEGDEVELDQKSACFNYNYHIEFTYLEHNEYMKTP
jgi:hypothetical protein